MEEIQKILDKLRQNDVKFKDSLTKSLQSRIIKQQIITNILLLTLVLTAVSRWVVMGN